MKFLYVLTENARLWAQREMSERNYGLCKCQKGQGFHQNRPYDDSPHFLMTFVITFVQQSQK